jgi:hypothetical protein
MARLRFSKTFQYCARPGAPHHIDGGFVGAVKHSATAPGADNGHSAFNRSCRDHLDGCSIILPEGIVRPPQFIRARRSPSEKISDDDAARAFAPSKLHTAANGGFVSFGVRVRRIQHKERQFITIAPPPREFIAITAVLRNIRGLSDRRIVHPSPLILQCNSIKKGLSRHRGVHPGDGPPPLASARAAFARK